MNCKRVAFVDKKLLDILVCPVSGAAVSLADGDTLARLNERVAAGDARYVDDSTVDTPLEAALITSDRSTAYRVDDGIPVMLPERGIDLPVRA
ncbi:Trm112 family protein [Endozoicomonas sp. G2_2]|uniref:Trm112 family protein n=1 Tax=Endozoicomonas sp. G2_2 TaxID=2821092 RepID=UPI001ADAF870|nr:Trm112 family protein [Endozoicomonas sp. G2_2]MBO9470727.1 Trm112 family protein [Endozoicomonas sp. G2_2]